MGFSSEFFIPLAYAVGLITLLSHAHGQIRFQSRRVPCETPASKSGACVPVISCRRYWGRNHSPDLSSPSCGNNNQSRICCPLAEDESIFPKQSSNDTKPEAVPPRNSTQRNSRNRARQAGASVFPGNCGRSRGILRRIVGGQDSVLGAWPWMAAVFITRRGVRVPECGGALITSSHVVTAAHCTVTARRGATFHPTQLLVRLGELNLASSDDGAQPVDIRVRSIIKHESFNLHTFQNDISILELDEAVTFNDAISPICLPFNVFTQEEQLVGRNAIVSGWGSTRFGGPGSASLQEVQLRIWSNEQCREVFRRDVPITQANLCAGDGDKDACRGDSGGPLMLPDSNGIFYLIGIVSFGRRCAEPGVPGVYTRVTTYVDWIEQKCG